MEFNKRENEILISEKEIFFSTWLSPEYFYFQFTIERNETIWKTLRLEIMTFPNLEGDKIIFVYPLFDSQFVIK